MFLGGCIIVHPNYILLPGVSLQLWARVRVSHILLTPTKMVDSDSNSSLDPGSSALMVGALSTTKWFTVRALINRSFDHFQTSVGRGRHMSRHQMTTLRMALIQSKVLHESDYSFAYSFFHFMSIYFELLVWIELKCMMIMDNIELWHTPCS